MYNDDNHGAAVAMDTLLLLLGLAELVIAIVSSGIGCGVLCCRNQVSNKSHPQNMMECNYQSILFIAIVSSGIGCGVLCCRNQVSNKSHPQNMMECNYQSILFIAIVSSGIGCGVLCCRNQVSNKSHPQNMMECNYQSILFIAIVSSGIGCGVLCWRNQVNKLEQCMHYHIHIQWCNVTINQFSSSPLCPRVSAAERSAVSKLAHAMQCTITSTQTYQM